MYYVLVKNGYEYDDEGYASGSNYGDVYEKIAKVYTSKKKAEGEAAKRNLAEFRGLRPGEYDPYRWNNTRPVDVEGLELPTEDRYLWDVVVPKDASDELVEKYQRAFPELKFWSVLEVED